MLSTLQLSPPLSLQELTQWQLFMVLFCAILTRVDASADTQSDQSYLGYLLVAFVVPGYIAMGYQIVKAYLDVVYEAYYEAKKTKEELAELVLSASDKDKSCCGAGGCLGGSAVTAVTTTGTVTATLTTTAVAATAEGTSRKKKRRKSAVRMEQLLRKDNPEIELVELAAAPEYNLLDAGSMQATYDEAFAYHHGKGVPENLERARELYEQVCARAGKLAAKEGELSVAERQREALDAKLKATGLNDSTLLRALAGVVDDCAVLLAERRALERESTPLHLDALNNLAAMYTRGEGGPRDYARALELWEVSCNFN